MYIREFAWGLDFCRALNKRNQLARWFILFLMGKKCRYELHGLMDSFEKDGLSVSGEYALPNKWYEDRRMI